MTNGTSMMAKIKIALTLLSIALVVTGCQDNASPSNDKMQTETASTGSSASSAPMQKPPDFVEPTSSATQDNSVTDSTSGSISDENTNAMQADSDTLAKGKAVYEAQCKTCHDSGLLNSPKRGDLNAWETRLDKGKSTLYQHSIQGFNKMPAQAVNGVSEADVKAAVDYLLAESGD